MAEVTQKQPGEGWQRSPKNNLTKDGRGHPKTTWRRMMEVAQINLEKDDGGHPKNNLTRDSGGH
jgi:hypothetical protein